MVRDVAAEATAETTPTGRGRPRLRRRTGVGLRALVGGLLIAVVALTVFTAHRNATRPPDSRYVVVHPTTGGLPVGHVLGTSDLALAPIEAGDAVRATLIDDPDRVVGRMLTRAVDAGEPLTGSSLAATGVRPDTYEVAVRPTATPDLSVGDEVIVYDTKDRDSEPAAVTTAVVIEVRLGGDGIGGSTGDRRVVLGVPSTDAATAVLAAAAQDRIALVLPRPGGTDR